MATAEAVEEVEEEVVEDLIVTDLRGAGIVVGEGEAGYAFSIDCIGSKGSNA